MTDEYDPFVRGRYPVGVRTIQARDTGRNRMFPCEIWYPAAAEYTGQDLAPGTQDVFTAPSGDTPRRQMAVRNTAAEAGTYPLIVFSHPSGGGRRTATFLCTHLSSHGYVVAALDHSETVAVELARTDDETIEQKTARRQAVIADRVPDIRFLLDHLLSGAAWDSEINLDPTQIGIVGHSFGGWTALAANEAESRIRAVVALAPAGASQPKPGILPAKLTFTWGRDVPTLYLVAENDAFLPLAGMYEIFERTPGNQTNGDLAPSRPHALHGRCRGITRGHANDAAVDPRAGVAPKGDAANRRALFRRAGSRIRAGTHALPHGCRIEATDGSAAVFPR